jgi:hypothetical protein
MIRALVVLALLATQAHADPINAIIGDASWTAGDPERADEDTRIATHLRFVHQLLSRDRANPARAVALDALADYIERGEFPRRTDDGYAGRRPRFIDDRGVHCAVGYLIAQTQPELARAIDDADEYGYVMDMRFAALDMWATSHGFTRVELAMIQPSYDSVPTEESTRRGIEDAKGSIVLACAQHELMKDIEIRVIGQKSGQARVGTRSTKPFARCFISLANQVEQGRGAYDREIHEYEFDMVVKLPSPEELVAKRLATMQLPDSCSPLPGEIPKTASFTAMSSAETGFYIRATTQPANPDVATCLEQKIALMLPEFANLRRALSVSKPATKLPSRFEYAQGTIISFTRAYAMECDNTQTQISATVTAKRGDEEFAIAIDSKNTLFAACVTDKLRAGLLGVFGIEYKGKRYLRLDRDVRVPVAIDLKPR